MAAAHSSPLRALALVLACGLVSAVVYEGADAVFSGATTSPASAIVSLDPVILTASTSAGDDTTTFDVPDVSGTYPTVKCMPITFTPGTPGTPVLVRPFVLPSNQPAGPLDPQLNVRIEFGSYSASANTPYKCGSFQPDQEAYFGTWSQFLTAKTSFDVGPNAGTITNEDRTYAARVTFTLINPLTPPAPGVMSRVVLSFGARPCGLGRSPVPAPPLPCVTKPFYWLGTWDVPPIDVTVKPTPVTFPLRATAPAYTHPTPPPNDVWNYDKGDGDADPGLTIQRKANGDAFPLNPLGPTTVANKKYQTWLTPKLPAALTLTNATQLQLWSAIKDFDNKQDGQATIALYDCTGLEPVAGVTQLLLNCGSPLPNSTVSVPPKPAPPEIWDPACAGIGKPCPRPDGGWPQKTWAFPTNFIHTFPQDHVLALFVFVENATDMQFAYNTVTYKSVLEG